jgi:hypothetical protein
MSAKKQKKMINSKLLILKFRNSSNISIASGSNNKYKNNNEIKSFRNSPNNKFAQYGQALVSSPIYNLNKTPNILQVSNSNPYNNYHFNKYNK